MLFNGFKPLFQALSPDDINQLSFEIVQVFQGEGGTLESLLGHTASVTKTLADRDEVITDLIVNLDDVLDRIADRDSELSDLIISFKQLVKGLKQDRKPILDSLEQISALSEETASLVTGIRKPFTNDILQLRRFADNVNRNKGELDRALQVLPIKLEKVGRTAIYGSYFNFYLCHFQGRVRLPGGSSIPVDYNVGATPTSPRPAASRSATRSASPVSAWAPSRASSSTVTRSTSGSASRPTPSSARPRAPT